MSQMLSALSTAADAKRLAIALSRAHSQEIGKTGEVDISSPVSFVLKGRFTGGRQIFSSQIEEKGLSHAVPHRGPPQGRRHTSIKFG